jgi:hypothetical protein
MIEIRANKNSGPQNMVRFGQGSKSQKSTRKTADGIAIDKASDQFAAANQVEHHGHVPIPTCQECTTYAAW